jgi:hypothetical protein
MVGGVETPCHTRLPSLNYAGSNVQPSVITHSLTELLILRGPPTDLKIAIQTGECPGEQ